MSCNFFSNSIGSSSTLSKDSSETTHSKTFTITEGVFDDDETISKNTLVSNEGVIEIENVGEHETVENNTFTENAKKDFKLQLPTMCHIVRSLLTVPDYQQLCREENDLKYEGEWDSSGHHMKRDMIMSKRMYAYVKYVLKNKQAEHARIKKKRLQQIDELKRGERVFGASFIYYNEFIKDNVEKRERALEHMREEQVIQNDIAEKISQTEAKIDKLTEIKNGMLKYIDDRKKFVSFLEQIRAKSGQFPNDVREIVARFELLVSVREKLAIQQEHAVRMMQELINKVFHITEERTGELINLHSKVTALHFRYDVAKNDAFHWTSLVDRVEDVIAKESRQLNGVKNTCWNLYLQICKEQEIPVIAEQSDLLKQLSVIENTIIVLRRALHLIRKKGLKHDFDSSLSKI